MRNWGIAVTGFYIVLVGAMWIPLAFWLNGEAPPLQTYFDPPMLWFLPFALLWIAGPLVLLLVPVDPTKRRHRQVHVAIPALAAALGFALLFVCAVINIALAIRIGQCSLLDHFMDLDPANGWSIPFIWVAVWLAWGIVLWWRGERFLSPASRVYRWLIAGSVLELLVAVPSHIIVLRRSRCSDPLITGFGVATGLSILLMSLGPAALFLYRARIRARRARAAPAP
jgi:hypothetical protein